MNPAFIFCRRKKRVHEIRFDNSAPIESLKGKTGVDPAKISDTCFPVPSREDDQLYQPSSFPVKRHLIKGSSLRSGVIFQKKGEEKINDCI